MERTTVRRAAARIAFMLIVGASAFAGIAAAHDQFQHPGHDQPNHKPPNPFVTRVGSDLYLRGEKFRFAGSNNYYPIYKSPLMVRALFDKAAAADFRVMRVWSTNVIGNADGTNSVDGADGRKEGVYMHYWDGAAPAFNDGPTGLERLDFVVAEARKRNLKLILPLVNNWSAFGGMDQYVRWRGGQYHDEFYTDPTIKGWFKGWIGHLLNRVNTVTGVRYKDDPTIMMWELGNEPRCIGSGVYPRSPSCSTQTLISWADEISSYIKSVDRNHLVSVGDEGFLCLPNGTDWTDNCNEGVDSYAFAALRNIDAMSLHLYPDADAWGKTPAWGTEWIAKHTQKAKRLRKAVYLGEFGTKDKSVRNPVYREWTRELFFGDTDGALYWILSDVQDNGALYPDYDGLTVYCPSPVCTTMNNFSLRMTGNWAFGFPPVADDDAVSTAFDTPAKLTPVANDIAYLGRQPVAATLDLDPATAGRQSTATTAAGSFVLAGDGSVTFTPAAGFQGDALASYQLRDTAGRRSNVAALRVKVLPDPNGALLLYSFENDTQGWAPASWQANAGTAARVTDFATQGTASLQVTGADGGWFGLNVAESVLDLSAKAQFKFDLRTSAAAGTSVNVAIQDRNWTWCEGPWGFQNPGTTATVTLDLAAFAASGVACPIGDFSDVNAIWVWVGAGATANVDNVRAE